MFRSAVLLALALAPPLSAAVIDADPTTYLALLPTLGPGDTLRLAAGDYTGGLPVWNMRGQAGATIQVVGSPAGPAPRFLARACCNTVSIGDSSYVEVRNLVLDGQGLLVDAVKAESTATSTDHITLEGLTIVNHGADQQIVGINTKCPSWGWVVRLNSIAGAGTGMYFGDSDGSAPFVAGLVEHNFVEDTIGYNIQVKHQIGRPSLPGMPQDAVTVIRNNVLSKANGGSTGADARPNLLVGHWPTSGPGENDRYEIYGNVFYQNPTEALFQGEGNIALYENLFVNRDGSAIHVQPQNGEPRLVRIFHNTVVARDTGIRVSGGDPAFTLDVVGNAVFAATPLTGGSQVDNVTDAFGAAPLYLTDPTAPLGSLDLAPLSGALLGAPIDRSRIDAYPLWSFDFIGRFHDGTRRGAYEGLNSGWLPSRESKPMLGDEIVAGQGPGQPNPNRVRTFTTLGTPRPTDFLAFAAGAWGVNVATALIDASDPGRPDDTIVAGPGPGPIFGPHVRGFTDDGAPVAKVSYYAYGTLKYGVEVAGGSVDGDSFSELVTGAGPGAVFGPHVRGWNIEGPAPAPIGGINFFAYGTLRYGVNVAIGHMDGDTFAELLTGPGPGVVFGPQVRGFDHDGSGITPMPGLNYNAFPTTQYGCRPAGGAVFPGIAGIVTALGPGPAHVAELVGHGYAGATVQTLPGYRVTAFPTLYGGRLALGRVNGGVLPIVDLLAAPGRDPAAAAEIRPFVYLGNSLSPLPTAFTAFPGAFGVAPGAGTLAP